MVLNALGNLRLQIKCHKIVSYQTISELPILQLKMKSKISDWEGQFLTIKSLLVPMFTHHNCNSGLLVYETVSVYNCYVLWSDCWVNDILQTKNCILIYMKIISWISNPNKDHILCNQKYIDRVLHVMMIKVGKLRTKRNLRNAFLLHSFVVKLD